MDGMKERYEKRLVGGCVRPLNGGKPTILTTWGTWISGKTGRLGAKDLRLSPTTPTRPGRRTSEEATAPAFWVSAAIARTDKCLSSSTTTTSSLSGLSLTPKTSPLRTIKEGTYERQRDIEGIFGDPLDRPAYLQEVLRAVDTDLKREKASPATSSSQHSSLQRILR